MSAQTWLTDIRNAKKSCIIQNKIKKVHYLFTDNREMVEEYSTDTNVLLKRSWKKKKELGGDGVWQVEIGDPEPKALNTEVETISESNNQPFVTRRITKGNLEWRIRNLPYDISNYDIDVDAQSNSIIVRTHNKKYYKKLDIPDLLRVGLQPELKNIEFTHKYNTLIITYKKPGEIINLEKAVLAEIKNLKPLPITDNPDNCKPS